MSSTLATIINILRLAAMGCLSFNSLVVLGTAGHQISLNSNGQNYVYSINYSTYATGTAFTYSVPYLSLAIAVSVITLVLVPPLLVIGFLRKGAIFNYVVVELAVLGLLWILWLSSAADTAQSLLFLITTCDYSSYVSYLVNDFSTTAANSCHELQALHAFSWLNWLVLTGYWPFLLVMSLIQHTRGNPVWTTAVNDVKFAPPVVTVVTPGGVYPPQQQPVYASQPIQQQPVVYPPSVPHSPAPTYAPAQSPQTGYIPTPPQQPFPHQGGGHFESA